MIASQIAILALALSIGPKPVPWSAVSRALSNAPPGAERACDATRPLIGQPYGFDPLGEEDGPDQDPRFRLDLFDCLTFVETAVAFGSADSLAEARRALDDIRYDGAPALANRRHEVLSQWIPGNVAAGYLRAITAEIAPGRTRHEEKIYDAQVWERVRRAGRAISGLPRRRLPLGRFGIDVVPPEYLDAVANAIPSGTLAFVVRADLLGRPTRISHVGLVVEGKGGERRVRHATSTKGVERVIEEPLDRFIAREERAFPRWPVSGLSFFQILDNRARLASPPLGSLDSTTLGRP